MLLLDLRTRLFVQNLSRFICPTRNLVSVEIRVSTSFQPVKLKTEYNFKIFNTTRNLLLLLLLLDCMYYSTGPISHPLDLFVKSILNTGSCTSDNLKILWTLFQFFFGRPRPFLATPTFLLFTHANF